MRFCTWPSQANGAFEPPTHPGVLIQDIIEEMGITQVELAKRLGIPLQRLNTIVRGKRGVLIPRSACPRYSVLHPTYG